MSRHSKTEDSNPLFKWHAMARQGMTRNSVAVYLCALLLLFISMPYVGKLENGGAIDSALVTLVLGMAVVAVGGRRRTLLIAIALVTPALISKWASHFYPVNLTDVLAFVSFLAFTVFVVGQFLWFILRSPRVNSEVLCAAVATYLMLALLWAAAYSLVGRGNPGAFDGLAPNSAMAGFDSLYFSIITLTTIGYGDIAPVSGSARMLATLEAITGTMYMAMLVARLVAIYSSADYLSRKDSEG